MMKSDDEATTIFQAAIDDILGRGADLSQGARSRNGTYFIVSRAVLAEALEQIETVAIDKYDDIRGNEVTFCMTCNGEDDALGEVQHKPDCRYVRVVEALRKLVAK